MIKKALEYLIGLGEANIKEVKLPDGTVQIYSDKPLNMISKHIPRAGELHMHTLSSLVEYIKADIDSMPSKMIIHIVSPEKVRLYSQLDEERIRESLVEVNAQVPEFEYERFIDHEAFCINVQAKFISDKNADDLNCNTSESDQITDKALLLTFAGTVEQGSVAEYGDDGITQKATVRQGIASKTDAIVPNPVLLRPYRTFIEVEQPVSQFIFRMRDNHGIQCALFEADGGAWKIKAMRNIKNYLESKLVDYKEQFTVIS